MFVYKTYKYKQILEVLDSFEMLMSNLSQLTKIYFMMHKTSP